MCDFGMFWWFGWFSWFCVISYESCGFDKIKGLILLLNKIIFENKIKYLVMG